MNHPDVNFNRIKDVFPNHDLQSFDSPYHFYELPFGKQIHLVCWCVTFNKSKRFNLQKNSYAMKHYFEDYVQGFYVTHGQFKGAMIIAGFEVKDTDDKYWHFNVLSQDLEREKIFIKEFSDVKRTISHRRWLERED